MSNACSVDPLSFSSSTVLKNCERKYWHAKVNKTPVDSDAQVSTLAMNLGKVLHKCTEVSYHGERPLPIQVMKESCVDEDVCFETNGPMIMAMYRKYKELHLKSGLKCEIPELAVKDGRFVGYVDGIMSDEKGWWIEDTKTAGSLRRDLRERLPVDPQLNIYAHKVLKMNLEGFPADKFLGTRYRVVLKSKATVQPHDKKKAVAENRSVFEVFSDRMYKSIKAYEFIVPAKAMHHEAEGREFERLQRRQASIWNGTRKPHQNLTYCDSYYKPCEWFSQCHGRNYTDESLVEVVQV